MLLYVQFLSLVCVAISFYIGMTFSLFGLLWWYDIPTHILGGVWAAFFALWLAHFLGIRFSFWQFVLSALAIGIIWETFEYTHGIGGSAFMSYPLDTSKDLFDDCIGGAIAWLIARRLRI